MLIHSKQHHRALIPPLLALGLTLSASAAAEEVHTFDYSEYQVSGSQPYKAALYAMLNRGWEIDNFDESQASGHLPNKDERIRINYDEFPVFRIHSEGNTAPSPKWLKYLQTDITLRLFSCP